MKYPTNVIKSAMNLRNITAIDVAKVAGKDKTHVHRYITGSRRSEQLNKVFKVILGKELEAIYELNIRLLNQVKEQGGLK